MIIFVQVVAIEQNYEMDSKRKNEAMEARKEWLEESEKPDFAARGASYWQKRVATLMSPISMLWTLYSPLVKMFVLIIRLNAVFLIFLPHLRPRYPRHNHPWHTPRHPRNDESRHAIHVKTCPGVARLVSSVRLQRKSHRKSVRGQHSQFLQCLAVLYI